MKQKDTADEVAVRRACANQMVTGLMDLMNEDIVKRDRIIITAAEPWGQWYGVTSQRLKSIDETQPSLKSFITSDVCEQYADITRESRSRMQCQF